ncbi:helicase-related protein [Streptomyces microflavus]|uniref:helicase-related protein n=1 Tax=Streptomyces microflavus TaxID=1919 RepID=UPI0036B498E2
MTTTAAAVPSSYAPGTLVTARGREWVVLPGSAADFLLLRPLGGDDDTIAGVLPALESVAPASFAPPTTADLGNQLSAGLLRTALRIGFRAAAGPLRSLAGIAVEPRQYQLVPLLLAMRQDTVRLLIADDVGIGKTVEAGLVVKELLEQGEANGLAVLCSPALAEQWQDELRNKFGIEAELVLPSTAKRLERGLPIGQSLFDRYPHVVISTDFIKSPKRRDAFVRSAPDLVVVDEAHTCVSDGSGTTDKQQKQQRYALLQRLAADPGRHLLLVTATPHSGKEEGFRNLIGLLDPALADVDLEQSKGRDLLARHMVQRRRHDIRRFLDQETPFPRERQTKEAPYRLSPDYSELMRQVLEYARESVQGTDGELRPRVRWWSALALLRALASSPRAAAATLRSRSSTVAAQSLPEVEALGRAAVLDLTDDDTLEGIDTTPGGDAGVEQAERRRLRAMADRAVALEGGKDVKLATLVKEVKGLLADGYDPIVFCRFIHTAEYVAEHLQAAVKKAATVRAVTGELPPAERLARIGELTEVPGRRVLVATDCLSEGVNLQEHFQAVVHYDLAWNPTRHEQREGRVDRFGQPRDYVRAITLYGQDNGIDGLVLDVLIRKYQAIRRSTGVAVPVPDTGDSIVKALLEGLLLRQEDSEQLAFDLDIATGRDDLHRAWESAAERENRQLTKFAQSGVRLEEVQAEVDEIRAVLGGQADVASFVREVLLALGSSVREVSDRKGAGFVATTDTLPPALKHVLGGDLSKPRDAGFVLLPPARQGHAALVRTDPKVGAVAQYVLDSALDPDLPERLRPAQRCGVIRTAHVATRTTLLLVRHRFHLTLPTRRGEPRTLVAEDARLAAFRGSPTEPDWLDEQEAQTLLALEPTSNTARTLAEAQLGRVLDALPHLQPVLDARAAEQAGQLRESHRRVRSAVGALKRGLDVQAQPPADILGVYLYLPDSSTAHHTTGEHR